MKPQRPSNPQDFDAAYGLELTDCSEDMARGHVEIRDELRAAGGFVHGGVYGAIADALATRGTAVGVAGNGKQAVGLTSQMTVMHPISEGTMHATVTRRHRGRTTWVWEVEIADDGGRLSAAGRVTVAVRDREPG